MQRSIAGLVLCLVFGLSTHASATPRIISTDAAATQILFALGLDSALVGVDVTTALPSGYREIPSVGYHRALSPEGILALEPTLVVGSEHIGPPPVLKTLASVDVRVLQLPSATTVAALKTNIETVAEATGAGDNATQALAALDAQTARLATAQLSGETVAFVLSVEPGKLRIAGNNTAGAAFIKLLGAGNVSQFDAYRTVSAEALLELNPSLILVAGHEGATPARLLALNPVLKHGDAASHNKVIQVNAANLVAGLSPGAVADAAELVDALARDGVAAK